MDIVDLTIDGQAIMVKAGTTIMEAAKMAGLYIPALCYHPDINPLKKALPEDVVFHGNTKLENHGDAKHFDGCGICLVKVEGENDFVRACSAEVRPRMMIFTEDESVKAARQRNLIHILTRHRRACLTSSRKAGDGLAQSSSSSDENERHCPRFGHCELQNVANYAEIDPAVLKWTPAYQPILQDKPLFERDNNLCVGCLRCVRVCRDLIGAEALGFIYDGSGLVQTGEKVKRAAESTCRHCSACVEACPAGALTDKGACAGDREEEFPPCAAACPARVDIPNYLRLIVEGKSDEALAVIREKTPFPGILGRVCARPCEQVCRRGKVDEPVSICALERYAADREKGLWKISSKSAEKSGKKAAVVGSGPSGLTAAFYLRKTGHEVVVFEKEKRPGGMLRHGIPCHRLPASVIDKEIGDILELGIELKTDQALGVDFTLSSLLKQGFDAVYLATGAPLSRRVKIEGSDLEGVSWGTDFLKAAADEVPQVQKRVIIIGGGNVAIDTAISAFRLGAEEVSMVCLEKLEEMPVHQWEVKEALKEGVRLMTSWGPKRILSKNGAAAGIELIECVSVFDDQGNFNPSFGESRTTLEGDQVILATGRQTDLSFLKEEDSISVNKGFITTDQDTLETGREKVYAGGDVVSARRTVIQAVADGRKAASAIDLRLGGDGNIDETLFSRAEPSPFLGPDKNFAPRSREKVPQLDMKRRYRGFEEVNLGFSSEQALKEAARCLRCNLRLHMKKNPAPLAKVRTLEMTSRTK